MAGGAVLDDFMRTNSTSKMLTTITIVAEKLKFYLLRITNYISIWVDVIYSWLAFFCAAAIDMIESQKFRFCFTTTIASVTKYFLCLCNLLNFSSDSSILMTSSTSECACSSPFMRIVSANAKSFLVCWHYYTISNRVVFI